VTPASSTLSNQGASGVNTPVKDANSATNTPSASINGAATGSEGGDREKIVNGTYDSVTKSDPLGVGTESESRTATLVNSIPASPSFGTASTSTLPKEEDITLVNTAPSESVWDRHSQPANGHEKSTEPTEGRRGKKGKKQKNTEKEAEKEAEKQKEEEKKLEMLIAAPPPAVNIWQQRAQALKVKPSSPATKTPQGFTEASNTVESAAKPTESMRKSKSNAADEGEKISSPGQPGSVKDLTNNTKGQKKGSEGASKAKEDTSYKRAGPRGGRVSENEKPVVSQLPPPVEDAISWPTPETALEEERRKALEKERYEIERSEKEKDKEERDEAASNKPRTKQKYVAVPFVPSVNFATPLPANRGPSNRGGRGRGGARGGRDSTGGRSDANGGSNGERANNGSAASPPGESEARGRGGSTTTRATSLPPNSNKRPSSGTRHQGKTSTAPNAEKTKATQTNAPLKYDSSSNTEPQRTSTILQVDQSLENQQLGRGEIFEGGQSENAQGSLNETILSSGAGDRRSEPNLKGSDQFKDGPNFGKDAGQARDRADGRADRGRGGFRGRGGHNTFANGPAQSQPVFTNGHVPQPPNGFPVRQNSNPYSPSMQQPPFSNQYVQAPPARGGRGGSRSQSIPNNNAYGRFPQNVNPQMAPLQTPGSMYDYQQAPLQTMSAGPYNGSYSEQISLLTMVSMQLEYYFSIDNLCKDVFLRKHMDSQGFVFLAFIAGFKRIQALTQEIELLRYACQESREIDLIKGEDGIDRLRRKDGWEKWVLGMEERDPSVRNAGPSYHHRSDPRGIQQAQQIVMHQGYPAMSPPMFSPNGTESRFPPQYGNGSPVAPVLNGNGSNHHTETPLSATVPDFAPSQPPVNGTADHFEAETTFGDDQVANLKLVFASPKGNDATKAGAPFHNASSRTFSNGSIDGRSIAEEILDPRQRLTNGSRTSEM
jgi:la-related protein 1